MAPHIEITPLKTNFGASISGVDFSKPVSTEVQQEIQDAVHKYGFVVFRGTALDDEKHVQFAKMFGKIDKLNIPPGSGIQARIKTDELQDQGNLDLEGVVLPDDSPKHHFNMGNLLFHVDNSYHPQRVKYSLLRGVELPPPEAGGNTDFIDVRQAWDDLPEQWKEDLKTHDYRVRHSMWHSRKLASPEFFARLDPTNYPSSLRRLVQTHPDTGRTHLYIAAHCFEIEGLSPTESKEKLDFLWKHATQDKYLHSVPWLGAGDMVIWDNRCVMHRGTPLAKAGGPHKRDLRRATILDEGPDAWSFDAAEYDFMKFWSAAFHVMQQYGESIQAAAKKQMGIANMDVTGMDKVIPPAPPTKS